MNWFAQLTCLVLKMRQMCSITRFCLDQSKLVNFQVQSQHNRKTRTLGEYWIKWLLVITNNWSYPDLKIQRYLSMTIVTNLAFVRCCLVATEVLSSFKMSCVFADSPPTSVAPWSCWRSPRISAASSSWRSASDLTSAPSESVRRCPPFSRPSASTPSRALAVRDTTSKKFDFEKFYFAVDALIKVCRLSKMFFFLKKWLQSYSD